MKRMLINATQPEEIRVATVDGNRLEDLDIEIPSKNQKKANVYKGKITRIEPSLEAAFVDYGAERHGFLPFKEIAPEYLAKLPDQNSDDDGGANKKEELGIKDRLKEGQEIIVQVEREERGQKGAALSTYVSLAGRYLVLMPNNPRSAGISRRIEGEERDELKQITRDLKLPDGMGLIVRTACVGKSQEDLQWDLDYLLQLWKAIQQAVEAQAAPFLVYQESNLIIRAFRDYLRRDIEEVVIDDQDFFEHAIDFVRLVIPHYANIIKLYQNEIPLFVRNGIESELETIYQHEVRLPSGGSIVIDHTEALVSIDVNSSKATKGGDIEETALNTNKEAAAEVARQLRLRDIGGLIVIDFIDMLDSNNQREVEQSLRSALKTDRARIQTGRISRFGLLEMSRQRLRSSIGEASLEICPRCMGTGRIRETESMALSLIRMIEEKALETKTKELQCILPVDVATFLLNEKREQIANIEKRQKVQVTIVPSADMHTPHYEIRRVTNKGVDKSSYTLAKKKEKQQRSRPPKVEKPAVTTPEVQAKPASSQNGFLKRMWTSLFGESSDNTEKEKKAAPKSTRSKSRSRRNDGGKPRRPQGRGRGGQQRRQQGQGNQQQQQAQGNQQGQQASSGDPSGNRPSGRRRRPSSGGKGGPRRRPAANKADKDRSESASAPSQESNQQPQNEKGNNRGRRPRREKPQAAKENAQEKSSGESGEKHEKSLEVANLD